METVTAGEEGWEEEEGALAESLRDRGDLIL